WVQSELRSESMRTFLAVALFLSISVLSSAQLKGQDPQPQLRRNPAAVCGDQSQGLPDFYYDAVLSLIMPPEWKHGLIRVMVGGEIKLALWTDGEKFKLWTDKPDIAQKNIYQFLLDLDQTCRLPPDPRDAFELLKINWQSKDLSAAQFAQLHRDFTGALSKYVVWIQGRYAEMIATRMKIISWTRRHIRFSTTIATNISRYLQRIGIATWIRWSIGRIVSGSWAKIAFIERFGADNPNKASFDCHRLCRQQLVIELKEKMCCNVRRPQSIISNARRINRTLTLV